MKSEKRDWMKMLFLTMPAVDMIVFAAAASVFLILLAICLIALTAVFAGSGIALILHGFRRIPTSDFMQFPGFVGFGMIALFLGQLSAGFFRGTIQAMKRVFRICAGFFTSRSIPEKSAGSRSAAVWSAVMRHSIRLLILGCVLIFLSAAAGGYKEMAAWISEHFNASLIFKAWQSMRK